MDLIITWLMSLPSAELEENLRGVPSETADNIRMAWHVHNRTEAGQAISDEVYRLTSR
jgi:hypothetical protein